jgi:hypothetical protein
MQQNGEEVRNEKNRSNGGWSRKREEEDEEDCPFVFRSTLKVETACFF